LKGRDIISTEGNGGTFAMRQEEDELIALLFGTDAFECSLS
jgi:hypothetical protein